MRHLPQTAPICLNMPHSLLPISALDSERTPSGCRRSEDAAICCTWVHLVTLDDTCIIPFSRVRLYALDT